MKYSNYSTVIIGGGIAGLYAALKIEQNGGNVLLITKSEFGESNSRYAQGGMVAVLESNKSDSVESHISDTIKAGAGLSELNAVKFISENSDKVVKDLLKFGVEFDRDEEGNFTLTKEAAHSVRRILHAGGDATGREMELALCNAVKNAQNITVLENTVAVDLLVENNICGGVIILKDGCYHTVYSDTTIVASGGIGQVYKYTTNPSGATGDGVALCYRAGAVLQDMEFVQFHPTALAFDDEENRFLISEAVRGEGAKLCDKSGYEFMAEYHEKRELAPRDIVARANFSQMRKNDVQNVYLNATGLGRDKLLRRFPNIARKCAEHGIDITRDYIPVAPAAHYFMGGVKTNLKGETSIKNLYAVGEVSSTGLHGANRLASNSLLECVVCAYSVSENIKNIEKKNSDNPYAIEQVYEGVHYLPPVDAKSMKSDLKDFMWTGAGIYRTEQSLEMAKKGILKLEEKFNRKDLCGSVDEYELRNMIIVSKLIIESALNRKESRGAHYRLDYLNTNDNGEHSLITKSEGELSFVK
ncbi:MAG: L-aspartate oxidase [Muribaculaceae bacterium]|nr:L-aspartate oxidase [Muribaculaceae bacterium]